MKKINLVLALLMVTFIVNAQESGKDAVVAVPNMNVLYLGIPNPIEIAVPGITSDKVSATAINGTIYKTTSGWEVKPSSDSDIVLTVLVSNKKVSEKIFRVKRLPVPVAVISGKSTGGISVDELLKAKVLETEMKDFLWDIKYEITGFTFLVTKNNYDYELISKGNKLTDEMKSFIADLKKGQNVYFKDIRAVGPDKATKDFPPIILTIN